MTRTIILKFSGDLNKITTGIYLLEIGSKYYIGKAEHMVSRCVTHVRNMNNSLMAGKRSAISKQMFDHILSNPEIENVTMSILERCKEKDLYFKEQYWVDKYLSSGKLINTHKKVAPSARDVARKEFRPGKYKVEFEVENIKQYIEIKNMVKSLSSNSRKVLICQI